MLMCILFQMAPPWGLGGKRQKNNPTFIPTKYFSSNLHDKCLKTSNFTPPQ